MLKQYIFFLRRPKFAGSVLYSWVKHCLESMIISIWIVTETWTFHIPLLSHLKCITFWYRFTTKHPFVFLLSQQDASKNQDSGENVYKDISVRLKKTFSRQFVSFLCPSHTGRHPNLSPTGWSQPKTPGPVHREKASSNTQDKNRIVSFIMCF